MNKKAIISIVIFLAIVAIASVVLYKNEPVQKLKRQLSLGDKYVSELKYEEAILAYEAAIEINPKTESAYIGIARAYIGLRAYDKAKEALERGIAAVGETESLISYMNKIMRNSSASPEAEVDKTESLQGDIENNKDTQWFFSISKVDFAYELFGKDIFDWTFDDLANYLESHNDKSFFLEEHDGFIESEDGYTYPDYYHNDYMKAGYHAVILYAGDRPYITIGDLNSGINMEKLDNQSISIGFSQTDHLEESDGILRDIFPTHPLIGKNISEVLSLYDERLPAFFESNQNISTRVSANSERDALIFKDGDSYGFGFEIEGVDDIRAYYVYADCNDTGEIESVRILY